MSHVGAQVISLVLLNYIVTGASSFRPGEVCEDINPHDFLRKGTGKSISRALAGKHLRIVELVWSPFAKRDPSVEGNAGWSGVDIDLFHLISTQLNFTYELHEMVRLANESWTETLFRHLMQGDLIGCYWLNTRDRRDHSYMLNGHIDSSMVMAVPPPKIEKPTFWAKFWTFLNPFSASAWFGIIAICIISGIGYYLLEGLSQGDLFPFESIYDQIGVMIFGENPGPTNPIARLHAPLWGFVCMVILSIYTANMASFMTLRARPVQRIKSIHDLINKNAPACIYKDEPLGQILTKNYPDIRNWRKMDSYLDVGLSLMGEGGEQCDALMVPRIELRELETNDKMCGMLNIGEPLIPNEAGWVTSFASSCVGQAIETELQDLYVAGKVDEIISKYRKAAACPSLADRQDDNEDTAVDLEDVAGLFIVYLVGLVSMILYKICFARLFAKTRCVRKAEKTEKEEGVLLSRSLRRCCFGENPDEDKEKVTLDTIMNRLDEMHKEIRNLQHHVQARTDAATSSFSEI